MIIEMQEIKFAEITRERLDSMLEWTKEHYGHNAIWSQQVESGNARWFVSHNIPQNEVTGRARFVFKNDEDATMFSLRWSS